MKETKQTPERYGYYLGLYSVKAGPNGRAVFVGSNPAGGMDVCLL
jgi:hypothetical protein